MGSPRRRKGAPSIYVIYMEEVLVGTGAVSEGDALLYDSRSQCFAKLMLAGELDEVRIWSTARNAREIRSDMFRTLTGTEPGLMGYWRFDEGTGTAIMDASGHGFDGTLRNGLAWVELNPPSWTDVADAPIKNGEEKVIVVSPPPGNIFYRLKK